MYNYKIIKKPQFSVIGYSRKFNSKTSYEKIPLFWNELINTKGNTILGTYGICYDCSNNEFSYMIADDYNSDKTVLQNAEIKVIPENIWAVFSCKGELPKSLQDLNTFIFSDWLPNNKEYAMTSDYSIEFYTTPSEKPEDNYSEIWVPIVNKLNMKRIRLVIPKLEDMHYRQNWMKDPDTMNYNAGFEMDCLGYDYNTGTITKTDEEMKEWYNDWIGDEPNSFFAYIYEINKNIPIGEIYFYRANNTYQMGILIASKYRGNNYSKEALNELLKIAFEKYGILELTDCFSLDRVSAVKLFESCGFKKSGYCEENIIFGKKVICEQFIITKDMYFNK